MSCHVNVSFFLDTTTTSTLRGYVCAAADARKPSAGTGDDVAVVTVAQRPHFTTSVINGR